MKKVNKIAGILILVIALLMSTINVSKAVDYGATMNLTSSTESAKVGDTVTFTLSLKSVTNVEGVSTVHAKINYDKTILQYVSCDAIDSWAVPKYNDENHEFITDKSDVMKPNGGIVKVTFKVIAIPTNNTTTVSITEFDVADNENQITVPDVSVDLKIQEQNNNTDDKNNNDFGVIEEPKDDEQNKDNNSNNNNSNNNSNGNQNSSNNSNTNKKDDTSAKDNKLPQTGAYTIIPALVAILAVISTIFIIKYKKMNDIK